MEVYVKLGSFKCLFRIIFYYYLSRKLNIIHRWVLLKDFVLHDKVWWQCNMADCEREMEDRNGSYTTKNNFFVTYNHKMYTSYSILLFFISGYNH